MKSYRQKTLASQATYNLQPNSQVTKHTTPSHKRRTLTVPAPVPVKIVASILIFFVCAIALVVALALILAFGLFLGKAWGFGNGLAWIRLAFQSQF